LFIRRFFQESDLRGSRSPVYWQVTGLRLVSSVHETQTFNIP